MIRSNEQARLAELLAVGRGMLLRYERLLESDITPCVDVLRQVIDARMPLLDQLADAERARCDLPPGGDHEANDFNAAVDSLLGPLFGAAAVQHRLLQAERHWAQMLDDGRALDWQADEIELFDRLRGDSRNAIAAIDACVE
jgi:hypothetical protein